MACEVPPHNLAEACEAAILLAEEPDAPLEALLERMPGPDFPTGGIVVNPEALAEAYERGQGTFRLQARFHVEQLPGNQQAIVVTELPYGVSPDQVVAEVVKAARAERIQDVTELPKNLSDRSGLRVQIRLKRGGDATRLVADLMRHTSLRVSVGINMTVLVDGVPKLVSLREALDRFVQFRFEVVTRRLVHERDVLLRELHRLVALLAALDAIDEVVRIVRGAEDDDDAREQLKAQLAVKPHGSSRRGADRRRAGAVDPRHAAQAPVPPQPAAARRGAQAEGRAGRRDRAHPGEPRRAAHDRRARAEPHRVALRRPAPHDARRRGAARRGARRQARHDGRRAAAHGHLGLLDRRRRHARPGRGRRAWTASRSSSAPATGRWCRSRPTRRPTSTPSPPTAPCTACGRPSCRCRRARSKGVRAVGVGRGGQVAALAPLEPEGGFLLLVTARGEVKRVEASVYASSHASGSAAYDVPGRRSHRRGPAARRGRPRAPALGPRAEPAHRAGPAAAGEEPGRGRRRRDAARRR